MAAINQVTVSGRLVSDPESRQAGSTNVSQFTVAVDKFRKEDGANFFDVVAFGKLGELVAQYLTKGSYVVVSGNLDQQTWEKDGQKRSKIQINARDVDFGPRVDGGQTQTSQAGPAAPAPAPGPINLAEIPF